MSWEELEAAYASQGEACGICRMPIHLDATVTDGRRKPRRSLHIDHDHLTGKFRGLLCGTCNTALGLLGDNIDGLLRAVAYLKEANARDTGTR